MSELISLEVDTLEKYSVLDLTATEDSRLSWSAKGLHTYLVSRPPGWQLYFQDLLNRSQDGKHALRNTIKELVDHGYLHVEQTRGQGGRFQTKWKIFRVSAGSTGSGFREADKREADKREAENRTLNNKQEVINKQYLSKSIKQKTATAEPEPKTGPGPAENLLTQPENDNAAAAHVSDLIEDLTKLDFSVRQARQLVEQYGAEKVSNQLRWLPDRKPKNPSAVLRIALTEDWGPPNGTKSIDMAEWKRKQDAAAAEKAITDKMPGIIEILKTVGIAQSIRDYGTKRRSLKVAKIDHVNQKINAINMGGQPVTVDFSYFADFEDLRVDGAPDPSWVPQFKQIAGGMVYVG